MNKEELYPTDEQMRRHFEKLVPEEMRNGLFDILTIDYMTELQIAAEYAVDNCVRKIAGEIERTGCFQDVAGLDAMVIWEEDWQALKDLLK